MTHHTTFDVSVKLKFSTLSCTEINIFFLNVDLLVNIFEMSEEHNSIIM